ncbi:MAG: cytochrome b/b6 domain-containing protein [Gammaproteobacteria bacterium]|nr:cytochrome b/b6 domain-containing protein [Gammaproteobacteria bacterium]
MTENQNPTSGFTRVRIWDGWIRLFHWSLVVSVVFLLISGETGWQFYEWHQLAGEFVLLLVVFRVAWSIAGSSNASLIGLVVNPLRAIAHLNDLVRGRSTPHAGHNAAGGWAVLVMLASIAFQAISGLFIADEEELIEGAFYGSVSSDTSSTLYSLHHLNAHLIQAVVVIHIAMIIFYALRVRQNLVKPMLTGWMDWFGEADEQGVEFQRGWVGAVLFVGLALAASWIFLWW